MTPLSRALSFFVGLLAVLGLTGWVFAGWFFFKPAPASPGLIAVFLGQTSGQSIEYKDFISIILTALGVMIAVLATTLGIAAIWGYSALREEMVKVATGVAETEARQTAATVATRAARESASQTESQPAEPETDYGHAAGSGSDDDAAASS